MYRILFRQKDVKDGYKTGKIISCEKFNLDEHALLDHAIKTLNENGFYLLTYMVEPNELQTTAYIDMSRIKELKKTLTPAIKIFYNYINTMLREEKLERICND